MNPTHEKIKDLENYIQTILRETRTDWETRTPETAPVVTPSIIGRLSGSLQVVLWELEKLKSISN